MGGFVCIFFFFCACGCLFYFIYTNKVYGGSETKVVHSSLPTPPQKKIYLYNPPPSPPLSPSRSPTTLNDLSSSSPSPSSSSINIALPVSPRPKSHEVPKTPFTDKVGRVEGISGGQEEAQGGGGWYSTLQQ